MSVRHLDEEAIFNVARRIETPSARRDYLEQVCGDNPRVRLCVRCCKSKCMGRISWRSHSPLSKRRWITRRRWKRWES